MSICVVSYDYFSALAYDIYLSMQQLSDMSLKTNLQQKYMRSIGLDTSLTNVLCNW